MRSPIALWAVIGPKGSLISVHTKEVHATASPAFGEIGVRYLRSDLTCGECAKRLAFSKSIPECGSMWFDWRREEFVCRDKSDPACMAFAPKVQP